MGGKWRRRLVWGDCWCFVACMLLGLSIVTPVVVATEVSVEITDRGRHQISIAVPPLFNQQDAAPEMASEMSAILRNDLRLSGFFNPLEEQMATIEGLHHSDLKNGVIQFSRWAGELNARLLIKGTYEAEIDGIKIEFRMYDTLGGDFILGKRYEGTTDQLRTIGHRFADEVIFKMTGRPGMSSTRIAFVSDRDGSSELYVVDFDGENLTRLTNEKALVMSPAVSPDGKNICYTSYKNNNPDLYILSLDTQQIENIAMFPGLNFAAAWSPDGRTLAVTLSKDGNPELYLLDSVSHEAMRLTKNNWNDVSASWSPDGMELVYTADQIGAPQLYIMRRGDSRTRRLTFRGAYNVSPAWSPDGELIAFSSSMDGNFNIYTVQSNGDNLWQLTQNAGNNEDPAWSPDGRYIVFQSTREETSSIYIMNADGTNQRRLTDNQGKDLSPDWVR